MGSRDEHGATSDLSDLTGVQPDEQGAMWGLAEDPGAYLLAVAPLLVAMAIASMPYGLTRPSPWWAQHLVPFFTVVIISRSIIQRLPLRVMLGVDD
jgi:hypothetical protein